MTDRRPAKHKKSKTAKRRAMDEEHGRMAQLWWMFGVGMLLLVSAYYQNNRSPEYPSERSPAQLKPASASRLPYSSPQTK